MFFRMACYTQKKKQGDKYVERYSDQERNRIIAQVQQGTKISELSLEAGIARSTVYAWLKNFDEAMPISADGRQITLREVNSLRRKVEKYRNMVQILQSVDCTVSSCTQDKLQVLESLYGRYDVHTLCESLCVPRGTFYNHMLRGKHGNTLNAKRREELREVIAEVYNEFHQLFGAGKITAVLRDRGYITTKKMVAELMSEMELQSISTNAKRMYKSWQKGESKNILKQRFYVDAPNKIWVSDVTVFKYQEVYYYIAAIIDIFSRKVVSYRISKRNSTQLITAAFRATFDDRAPAPGLIFHSDRGTQYTSFAFEKLLHACQAEQSFSKSGCPHDNAVIESFFAYLKKEELYRRRYTSVKNFLSGIDRYIAFYNDQRPHGSIHYKTPSAFEEAYNIGLNH